MFNAFNFFRVLPKKAAGNWTAQNSDAKRKLGKVTFGFHVTVCKYNLVWYNGIKPVFSTDGLSSFTRLDFMA